MDHSGMTTTSSGMMVPYLHFSGGDSLFLSIWAPSSPGNIAAACFGLFLMALLERWLAATRTVFDLHWQKRALAIAAARDREAAFSRSFVIAEEKRGEGGEQVIDPSSTPGESPLAKSTQPSSSDEIALEKRDSSSPVPLPSPIPMTKTSSRLPRLRSIPPFISEHDIPRGILFAFQMLIGYLLMLAVMTYQGAYLISIVIGSGIGEMLFGRVSRAGGGH